ncbi:NfeD-like protein [Sinanaerobacter sp. ZZT-01]|uniref:NfeD-like protein n=1 Tax=Sinanaerobacter sp. ZZT-01 TaxID=3111540 RepID=UPI002D777819|nr:NfeD-like protein [Sinanaerobacter sp. ZZT-01]WRR92425.1 NfeD-like protein [Sinanaerobacter sp. ZZT-01]
MVEWWNELDEILKILYCIAIPATLIMVIQTILSLVGGFEGGAGVDFSDTSGIDFNGGSDIGDLSDASDLGGDDFLGDGGNPADFSIMSMFTLQGIVTFLTVMGWTSIVAIGAGTPAAISIIVGVALGFVSMFAVAKLIHISGKLTENGTLNLNNAIGENGKVYIPIPAESTGEGKVTLYLQGRYAECDAITFEKEQIATGTMVRITDVRNGVLIVEIDK